MEAPARSIDNTTSEELGFKFNADAPEFVPMSHDVVAPICYFYGPWLNVAGEGGGDWFYLAEQPGSPSSLVVDSQGRVSRFSGNTGDALQRIVKQVEFQFSDANLLASDYMMKLISKDPQGFVPIAAIVSQKKVKSLGSSNLMLAKALRTSPKLDVSEDGKKVRRRQIVADREKEEVQARTVVVENLPEECSYKKLEKIFNTVGRVLNVRICHPHESNSARSYKSDVLISNKLHALVEYETADQAEKAAEKLNDERNWRKGLRVRVMLRRSPRSVMRNRREDHDYFNDTSDEDEPQPSESSSAGSQHPKDSTETAPDSPSSSGSRPRALTRAKSGLSKQSHNARGVLSTAPQSGGSISRSDSLSKQQSLRRVATRVANLNPSQPVCSGSPRGPRMPDGTRGFAVGRGKPLKANVEVGNP